MTTIATVQFSVVARTPYLGQLGQADINQDINEEEDDVDKEEEQEEEDKEEEQEEENKQNNVNNHAQINLNVFTWSPKLPVVNKLGDNYGDYGSIMAIKNENKGERG